MTSDDIIDVIGDEAMWMQLAEEAAELSRAAAKMARYLHGTNPVAKSETEIRADIIEEYADVINCAQHLAIPIHKNIIYAKNERWRERLGLVKEQS